MKYNVMLDKVSLDVKVLEADMLIDDIMMRDTIEVPLVDNPTGQEHECKTKDGSVSARIRIYVDLIPGT